MSCRFGVLRKRRCFAVSSRGNDTGTLQCIYLNSLQLPLNHHNALHTELLEHSDGSINGVQLL